MRNRLLSLLLVGAWSPVLIAQPIDGQSSVEPVLGMRAAVEDAILTHPLLRSARGALLQAQEGVAQAQAGYYPQIRGGINSSFRGYDSNGFDSRHTYQASVSATQVLYDFGKVRSEVADAQAQRDAARAELYLTLDDLVRRTAQAWIEVHRQQALALVAEQQLAQMTRLADLVAEREASGASPRSDRVQSQARVEQAKVELVTAQARIRQWRNALQHLTGHERLPDIAGDPPAALAVACARVFGDDGSVSLMVESDVQAAPAMLAAEARLVSARALLDQARAQLLPTLSVEADVSQGLTSGSRRNGRSGPEASVGVSFSAPIYEGGRNQSRERAAEHALAAASAALEQVRLDVSQSLQSAAVQWYEHSQRARGQEQRITSLESTRELYRQQYLQLGTRTLLDLLNSEQEYHGARSAAVESQHEIYLQSLECLYQTGQLRETFGLQDLAADVARLAESH